jgi:hypothetical protein
MNNAARLIGESDPPPWSVEEQPACFVVRDHSSGLHLLPGSVVMEQMLRYSLVAIV